MNHAIVAASGFFSGDKEKAMQKRETYFHALPFMRTSKTTRELFLFLSIFSDQNKNKKTENGKAAHYKMTVFSFQNKNPAAKRYLDRCTAR